MKCVIEPGNRAARIPKSRMAGHVGNTFTIDVDLASILETGQVFCAVEQVVGYVRRSARHELSPLWSWLSLLDAPQRTLKVAKDGKIKTHRGGGEKPQRNGFTNQKQPQCSRATTEDQTHHGGTETRRKPVAPRRRGDAETRRRI